MVQDIVYLVEFSIYSWEECVFYCCWWSSLWISKISNWLMASITVQIFLPWHWLPWGFCSILWWSCLFNFRGKGLLHDLTVLRDLRRVVDSSICSDLYLLLRWSGILQVLYVWNWQLEVSVNNWIIFISNIHHMSKSVLGVKMVGSKNCTSLIYRYSILTQLLKNNPYPRPTPFIK